MQLIPLFFMISAGLSFLVWVLAASFIGTWNSQVKGYYVGMWDSPNAVLAWGLISWLYFTAAIVVHLLVSPANAMRWAIVEIPCLFFFFVFGLGAVGSFSSYAWWMRQEHFGFGSTVGGIGQATLAFGWLLILLIMGTLIYELVVIIRNHNFRDGRTWKSSFYELEDGSLRREKGGANPPVQTV